VRAAARPYLRIVEKNRFPTSDELYALQLAARRNRALVMGRMARAVVRGIASLLPRTRSTRSGGLHHA